MALNKNLLNSLGAEPAEPENDIYSELGAKPVEDVSKLTQENDVSKLAQDLGAEPVDEGAPDLGSSIKEGVKAAVPGYKFFEDILDGFKKTKARQDELAAQQANAAAAEQQKIAEQDADPATWSSTRFKKEAPKPRTMEEQAIYKSILTQKKEREKSILEQLNPTRVPDYSEAALPKIPQSTPDTVIETLKNMPLLGGQSIRQMQANNRLMYDVFERPAGGLRAVAKEAPMPEGVQKTAEVFVKGFLNPENYPAGTFASSIVEAASSPDAPQFLKPLADPTLAGALGTIADAGYYFGVPEAVGRLVTTGKTSLLKQMVSELNQKLATAGAEGRVTIPDELYQQTAKNKDVFEVVDMYARSKNLKVEIEPARQIEAPAGAAGEEMLAPRVEPELLTELGAEPVAEVKPPALEAIEKQEKNYADAIEELTAKLPQSEAEEALRLADEAEPPPTPEEGLLQQDGGAGPVERARERGRIAVPSGTGFAAPAEPTPTASAKNTKPTGEVPDAWQPKVLPAEKIAQLPKTLGGMEHVRALEMPELVRMAREITGSVPQIVEKTGQAYGRFIGRPGQKGEIKLIAKIFKDPDLAAGVMAHEIGHNIDWLPEGTLKRGNLIGRAISSVNRFMAETFKAGEKLNRGHIRRATVKKYLADNGIDPKAYEADKALRQKHAGRISKIYKQDVRAAAKASRYLINEDFKKELEALTTWWHPFTPVKGDTYTNYRFSARELYAEFLSVLLNAPAKAQELAPKFFDAFFENLDAKPEVKQSFFELQDLLVDPSKVLKRREADIAQMFERSRQEFANLLANRTAARKNIRFLLRYHFIDRNAAILDARDKVAKTSPINPEDDPKYLLEENSMIGSFVKSYLDDFNKIYEDLKASGLDFDKDFGQYIFLKRVIGDRAEMANPLGQTPATAARQLDALKERLGTERFAELEKFVGRARSWFKDINALLAKDVLNESQKKMVQENDDYAPFRVTKYLKEYASAGFMQQVGTLNDIENPGASLVLKGVAMLRLYKRNAIEKTIGDFLLKNSFGEPAAVKTYDGKVHVKEHPELDVIKWRSGGKWRAAYVDPYIADSFKFDDSGVLQSVGEVFRKVLLNDVIFRPVYITFNVGFQSFNLIRDFQRFWKNTPGLTLANAIRAYKKAVPTAFKRVKGDFDQTVQKMEREGALNITMNDMIMGQAKEDTEIEAVLSKYSSITPEKKTPTLLKPLVKILDAIKFAGDVIETIPKVAGYNQLANMPAEERAQYVRNYIGTPNFKRKGKMAPLYNNLFMFSNIIKEGIRSDYEAAFKNPKTRAGYWWKTIKIGILPKILMALASAGYFGKALKDHYEKQTEYDKTNYITFPLGEDERGKAVYGRIPMDESLRFISGLFWKSITQKEYKNLLAFTGGQLPSLSPMLNIGTKWAEFLTGGNPKDDFRNQDILTQDEAKAGGMEALEPMVRWTINQSGLVHMDIRDRLKDETLLEKTVALTPIANRFIRISDYGQTEVLKDVVGKQQSVEARQRLSEKDEIRKAIREGKTAGQAAKDIPYKDKKDFIRKYEKERTKPGADPVGRALSQASSNAQKLAVLSRFSDNFETASEYRRALVAYYREKNISLPVLNKALKQFNQSRREKTVLAEGRAQ